MNNTYDFFYFGNLQITSEYSASFKTFLSKDLKIFKTFKHFFLSISKKHF